MLNFPVVLRKRGTHKVTVRKIDVIPQPQLLVKLMTSVVIRRLVPGRDSADDCEFHQLLGVPVQIPRVQFLDKFDTVVIHALDNVVGVTVVLCNGVPQVPVIMAEMLSSSIQDDLSAPP